MSFTSVLTCLLFITATATATSTSPCPKCDSYFIVAGGTTSANTGEPFEVSPSVTNKMWNGTNKSWVPLDLPMTGINVKGDGSSPWYTMAQNLSRSEYEFCLINVAKKSSTIEDWYPSSQSKSYWKDLEEALQITKKCMIENNQIKMMVANDTNITLPSFRYVLWQHGESNSNYENYDPDYQGKLSDMIKSVGATDPDVVWVISHTSYSPWNQQFLEANVRDFQNNIVSDENADKVFAGPNTDALCGDNYRTDDGYFNAYGTQRIGYQWYLSLKNNTKFFPTNEYRCDIQYLTLGELIYLVLHAIAFVCVVATCVFGIYYCIRVEQTHYKVYYMVNPNAQSEQHHKLINARPPPSYT